MMSYIIKESHVAIILQSNVFNAYLLTSWIMLLYPYIHYILPLSNFACGSPSIREWIILLWMIQKNKKIADTYGYEIGVFLYVEFEDKLKGDNIIQFPINDWVFKADELNVGFWYR